jgi:hypothetical protein
MTTEEQWPAFGLNRRLCAHFGSKDHTLFAILIYDNILEGSH